MVLLNHAKIVLSSVCLLLTTVCCNSSGHQKQQTKITADTIRVEMASAEIKVREKFSFPYPVPATVDTTAITKEDSTSLFPIILDRKWGFINKAGEIIINPQFDVATDFSEGLARVRTGRKWGFINQKGKLVIDLRGCLAENFSEELAVFWFDISNTSDYTGGSMRGYIGKAGNVAIPAQFYSASSFSEGFAVVQDKKGYRYIDRLGKTVLEPNVELAYNFSEGMAKVKVGKKWGYLGKSGKVIIDAIFDQAYDFSNGLAVVGFDNSRAQDPNKPILYGYIDKTGEIVIKPKFRNAQSFYEGLTRVNLDGKSMCIDKTGKKVCDLPGFLGDFSEGLAAVHVKFGRRSWGYIDKTGKIVIEARFDEADTFEGGLARVKVNGKWGYIDDRGQYVWNPSK